MTTEALYGVIVILVGGYWVQLMYRLHKAEEEISQLRKEFATSTTAVAVAAANALNAAAQAMVKK